MADRNSELDGEYGPEIKQPASVPAPPQQVWNVPENPAVWDGYVDEEDEQLYEEFLDRSTHRETDKVVYVSDVPAADKDEFGIN